MNGKIKVLHIISDSNFGGAGRLLLTLSECINKSKFEFLFAVPNKSLLCDMLQKEGSVFRYSGNGDKSLDIKAIHSIVKIVKKAKPHIVHTHSLFAGRLAARLAGIKTHRIVYTKHCVFEIPGMFNWSFCRHVYSFIDNLTAGHVVAVAEVAKEELINKGVNQNKITVIINGSLSLRKYTDSEKEYIKKKHNIKNEEFVAGIVARLEKYKGHDTFLEVAYRLSTEGKKVKFIIVGDGSRREELRNYVKNKKIEDNVIFTGFSDNVSEYMNIFDVNVNCSYGTETSCLAISEGFSIGVPAVVSDYGGNKNMVINGLTGFVFTQKNSAELYKIIVNLIQAPEVLKNMRENCLDDYEKRFSAVEMTRQYEDLYEEIVNNISKK